MCPKRFAAVVAVGLLLWGCGRDAGEKRVAELLAKQGEHARQISQLAMKVDSLDGKLAGIGIKVDALLASGVAAEPGKAQKGTPVSGVAASNEYQGILRQIAALQEQLAIVQNGLADSRAKESAAWGDQKGPGGPGFSFSEINSPRHWNEVLDALVKNSSGKIADPALKEQFVREVESLRSGYTAALSPEQKLQEARALLTERLNAVADEKTRGIIEGQLQSLNEGVHERLEERVEAFVFGERVRQIRELKQKYNLPEEGPRGGIRLVVQHEGTDEATVLDVNPAEDGSIESIDIERVLR